jgi:hypothetical protein
VLTLKRNQCHGQTRNRNHGIEAERISRTFKQIDQARLSNTKPLRRLCLTPHRLILRSMAAVTSDRSVVFWTSSFVIQSSLRSIVLRQLHRYLTELRCSLTENIQRFSTTAISLLKARLLKRVFHPRLAKQGDPCPWLSVSISGVATILAETVITRLLSHLLDRHKG